MATIKELEYAAYATQTGLSGVPLSVQKLSFYNLQLGTTYSNVQEAEIAFLKNKTGLNVNHIDHLWRSYMIDQGVTHSNSFHEMQKEFFLNYGFQNLQSYIKSLSGLVAYWPLDETSGNAINQAPDTLGSYDGTVVGATQGVAGQVGNAYQFDGVNDDILIGTLLDPNYSAMTLGGIIYVDSTGEGANRTIMAKRDTYAEADMRWQLTIGSGNLFFFGRSGSSNVFESGTYSTNTFFLFHIVQKASNLLYYRNGALIQTDTATTNGSDGTSEFRIGSTSSVEYFKGKMQHLHIVNRELNTTEIGNIKSLSGL